MNNTKHTPKAFTTFKRAGIQFITIPHNDGIAVLDEDGNNYGSYHSQESFESFAGRNGGFEYLKLGEANLAIHNKAKVA